MGKFIIGALVVILLILAIIITRDSRQISGIQLNKINEVEYIPARV